MICRRFLSFVFVASLAFFSGLFITTRNSYADETPLYSFDLADYFYDEDGEAWFDYDSFGNDTGTDSTNLPPASYYVVTTHVSSELLVLFPSNYPPQVYFQGSYSSSPVTTSYCYPTSRILSTPPTFYTDFGVYDSDTAQFITGLKEIDIYSEGLGFPSSDFSEFSITAYSSCPSVGGTTPSGNLDITANGTYDVTNYASATVNVPAEVIQGDYHDDLVNIQKSITICGAILLVLYFFYCIYRLIIKNSGVH